MSCDMRSILWAGIFLAMTILHPLFGNTYFGTPPKKWQCVHDSTQLPKRILVLYVGQGSTRFAPTLHLAMENIQEPLDAYLQSAKAYHETTPGTTCQDLGILSTASGDARLLQIQSMSAYGEVILLQAYVLDAQCVYVATATALKEDFEHLAPIFYDALRSVQVKNRLPTKSA